MYCMCHVVLTDWRYHTTLTDGLTDWQYHTTLTDCRTDWWYHTILICMHIVILIILS